MSGSRYLEGGLDGSWYLDKGTNINNAFFPHQVIFYLAGIYFWYMVFRLISAGATCISLYIFEGTVMYHSYCFPESVYNYVILL